MLTEQTTVDLISVLSEGQLEVRLSNVVLRDGIEVAKTYHRHCLSPGDDLSNEDPKVVAIANAAWA